MAPGFLLCDSLLKKKKNWQSDSGHCCRDAPEKQNMVFCLISYEMDYAGEGVRGSGHKSELFSSRPTFGIPNYKIVKIFLTENRASQRRPFILILL